MKIVIDARALGSCPSGIGFHIYDFVKELAKKAEFEITLLTDVAESSQMHGLKQMGVSVWCYGSRVFRSIEIYRYFLFVRRFLVHWQPDLFWEPNHLLPVSLKGYHGKTVVTIHDLFPLSRKEHFSWYYRLYFLSGIRGSAGRADAFLFNSKETEKQAIKCFPEIWGKERYISYPIVRKPPGRPVCDGGFFLYIGNLEMRKGTDILLDSYRLYRKGGGKRPLVLGGNIREKKIGRMLAQYQAECSKLHYLGYVKEKKKYDLLASCACFVFPSRAEGFGVPPLEAMAYGKPLITSDLSIFSETLPVSVPAFSLKADPKKQAEDLAALMLEESWKAAPLVPWQAIEELYGAALAGERLAHFFKRTAEEKDCRENA
ncbi:MAG: glycosyltransferase family 4 protein [Lachnospiraceae bacterium]|nr:glycosyltransferase family 4 protein [Lachnospiraceae bacterium]